MAASVGKLMPMPSNEVTSVAKRILRMMASVGKRCLLKIVAGASAIGPDLRTFGSATTIRSRNAIGNCATGRAGGVSAWRAHFGLGIAHAAHERSGAAD